MKKILIFFLLLIFCHGASAQFYKCTGDRVRLRTTPSQNTTFVVGYHFAEGVCQVCGADCMYSNCKHTVYLRKNTILKSNGVSTNGFIKVYSLDSEEDSGWKSGWIPAKYLVKAQKCTTCNGRGHLNKKCQECEGGGCDWCVGSGKEDCSKCYGGYR